jgi:hypothetical protein
VSKWEKFKNNPGMFFKDIRVLRHFAGYKALEINECKLVGSDCIVSQKTNVEYAEELLNFQDSYPIHSLVYKYKTTEVLLWPIFRHLFWVRLQLVYKNNKNVAVVNPQKIFISKDWADSYHKSHDCINVDEISNNCSDLLFFVNLRGTEQTKIDGKVYSRITDPVLEEAAKKYKCEKIEIVKSPGNLAEKWFHKPTRILPPMVREVGHTNYFEATSNFISAVNSKIPSIPFVQKDINETVEWFFHIKNMYKKILLKKQPKAVFFVGFDYHYALAQAASELGIKAVDLQHGVQAGWSPVYNFWNTLPTNGYEMFPDYFWVWGEYDRCKINENFCDHKSFGSVIGGFKWLDRQLELQNNSSFLFDLKIKLKGNSKKIGIISLQDQSTFPALMHDIIQDTSETVLWIVKRHPKYKYINLDSIKGLALVGKSIDEMPFSSLIKRADYHLTECSSSVIEADFFDVPSFVYGEQGLSNYADFIDDGSVFLIRESVDFIKTLESILSTDKRVRMNVVDNSLVGVALDSICKN